MSRRVGAVACAAALAATLASGVVLRHAAWAAVPSAWQFAVAVAWGRGAVALAPLRELRQQEADGCGAAALHVLLAAHGTRVPQRLLWSMCRVPGGGARLGSLARAARCFGHRPVIASDPGLERTSLPAIVHLRRGHFVVLEARDGTQATVFDPGCGRVRVDWPALRRRASGAVLALDSVELDA
jgi:ABC-type bacteriocin/lantibiotic exporter with double-glycine peptidase domain